jgi:hypothetical protein
MSGLPGRHEPFCREGWPLKAASYPEFLSPELQIILVLNDVICVPGMGIQVKNPGGFWPLSASGSLLYVYRSWLFARRYAPAVPESCGYHNWPVRGDWSRRRRDGERYGRRTVWRVGLFWPPGWLPIAKSLSRVYKPFQNWFKVKYLNAMANSIFGQLVIALNLTRNLLNFKHVKNIRLFLKNILRPNL